MRFVSEIVFVCLIALYSFVITRYIPKRYYSFSNLLIACGALGYGIIAGLNTQQLGLNLTAIKQSAVVGAAVALPVVVVIFIMASHKNLRRHFSNTPGKQYNLRTFCYELLFRVPFGTAFSEEVIFRSVLLALLISSHSTVVAVIISSLLFGLWHILPTLHTIKSHDPLIEIMEDTRKRNLLALTTTVLATTVAGVIFALLTITTDSFIAAWILHSVINGTAILGGYMTVWYRHRTTTGT